MNFRLNKAKSDISDSNERLSADFRQLVAASEDLLKKTAAHTGDGVDDARAALQRQLSTAQGAAAKWQKKASKKYKQISSASDEFVHDNPWKAVGIAAIVGIAVSLLAAAAKSRD